MTLPNYSAICLGRVSPFISHQPSVINHQPSAIDHASALNR
jgi:hypothetical protein